MVAQSNRLEQRKAKTRAALVTAAQGFIADGKMNAAILEITQAADVGMGSFYNHFDSKEQLFDEAGHAALEALGAYLDALTGELQDPLEKFVLSFRLTGRLFRLQPEMSRVVLNSGTMLFASEDGLGPRAKRDIAAAAEAGRVVADDPELATALVAGALLGLGRLLLEQPERDDSIAVDAMAVKLLLALSVSADDAHALCSRPVPQVLAELSNELS